ncbi:hypothetical protein P4233_22940 [Pseudomonas aeruginosa]|nr:hypothetical protein [Pseudomonas aeruginosa]
MLLAIAALYLFPVAPLPAPSGPYAVGVRDFELDDPSRPGLLGTPAGQPRRLLVRAWYPARPIAGAAPRHYFDPGEARSTARGFGEILGFPPLLAYLKHLRTNSYPDAPLRDDSARLPVVFYSHGYSAFAGGNWTLMEELASHGYAVYAIQHSGDASPTRLPDGTLLPMDPGLVEHLRRAAHDGLPQAMRQGYVSDDLDQRLDGQLHTALDLPAPANRAINLSAPVWLADRLFVHDRLQAGEVPDRVADLVAASDFAHTGEMGMSFGGSTTGAVCMVDRRCAAAVNLDGGDFDFAPFDSDLPAPLLMLHADLGNFYRLFGIEPPARPKLQRLFLRTLRARRPTPGHSSPGTARFGPCRAYRQSAVHPPAAARRAARLGTDGSPHPGSQRPGAGFLRSLPARPRQRLSASADGALPRLADALRQLGGARLVAGQAGSPAPGAATTHRRNETAQDRAGSSLTTGYSGRPICGAPSMHIPPD